MSAETATAGTLGHKDGRTGGVAGTLYVVVAVVAAALPGAPPPADGRAITYQHYFIAHDAQLVAQGWMYAAAVPLLLVFAVTVRRLLRSSGPTGLLSELFVVGTAVNAALLVVTMSVQIVFAQSAQRLDAEVVFIVGVHFPAVVIGLWGFVIGLTACVYAVAVFRYGVLPRWTGYLAMVALTVNLIGTAGVFVSAGAFSVEGGFSAWAPAASTLLWYLGTSIALLRRRGTP